MDEKNKIIVLDDDSLIRGLVCEFIEDVGFEPVEASSITKAEALIAQYGDAIRGMVADNNLESRLDNTGWNFAKKMHDERGMPVMLMTGGNLLDPEKRAMFKSFPIVAKPFDSKKFHETAKQVFGRANAAQRGGASPRSDGHVSNYVI